MPKNFQEMGWQHWLKTGNYSGDWMVLQEVQPHRCGDFLWEAFVLFFWCIVNVGLGRSPCCLLWHRGFTINIDIKSRVLFIYLWIYFYFFILISLGPLVLLSLLLLFQFRPLPLLLLCCLGYIFGIPNEATFHPQPAP